MARGRKKAETQDTGVQLGIEAELFKAADKLRGNMEPSDYKHVALGLIFLKYISDAFELKHSEILASEYPEDAEDRDMYTAENIFWVPQEARWSYLKDNAKLPTIGTLIDDAMRAIEKDNESLKGVLPKDYARPALDKHRLGELIDLIGTVTLVAAPSELGAGKTHRSVDLLGRVYEYFLKEFAVIIHICKDLVHPRIDFRIDFVFGNFHAIDLGIVNQHSLGHEAFQYQALLIRTRCFS